MTPDRPLWLAPVLMLISLAPLAWMGRQWLKEWRAYKAGTMLPRGYRPPEPPTLRQPWRWRFLWLYAAQAAAISGLMWLSFLSPYADRSPTPPQAYFVVFITWTIVVAFATAVLTRLWDRATSFRRGRSTTSQGQQPPREQVGVPAARGRLHQRP